MTSLRLGVESGLLELVKTSLCFEFEIDMLSTLEKKKGRVHNDTLSRVLVQVSEGEGATPRKEQLLAFIH